MKYFLASKSPRRRELLKFIIEDFELGSSNIDEVLIEEEPIKPQLMSLAFQKANVFDQNLQKEGKIDKGDIVIGADTIVYLDGILQKPSDEEDAIRMLEFLSGKKHMVYTALAIIKSQTNEKLIDIVETDVYFRELNREEIVDYVSTGDPMDKAGSYAIQGKSAKFIERVDGDFYAVMGLPICKLDSMLRSMK